MKFCVVGGINLDVIANLEYGYRLNDSNPGKIRFGPGGVGCNIAAALSSRGHTVSLITALSNDVFGEYLKSECQAANIDISKSVAVNGSACCYAAMHTPDGELLTAVNDMANIMYVTPKLIEERADFINGFDALITEANLGESALEALARAAKIPIIADAVSAAKCARLEGILPYLSALKLNLIEARTLSGEENPKDAGQTLIRRGVKCVLVSMGAQGVYACDRREDAFLKNETVYSCDTSGAGDAMCAGLSEGIAMNLSAVKCAAMAQAAASALLVKRSSSAY